MKFDTEVHEEFGENFNFYFDQTGFNGHFYTRLYMRLYLCYVRMRSSHHVEF